MANSVLAERDSSQPAGRIFSAGEVEQFERDGFVIVRGLCGEETRRRLLEAALGDLRDEKPPVEYEAELHYPGAPQSLADLGGRTIRRLKQAYQRHPAFAAWATCPDVVERLRQLLGPEIVMPLAHHNCVMTKHPRFSSETGWHQDIRYWSYQQSQLVTAWLSLSPEKAENGCLQLIPGSHRAELDRSRFDAEMFFRDDLPDNQPLIAGRVLAEMEPGDVLFFHCRTLHAAGRNTTQATKYSVVFTYRAAGNLPIAGSRSAAHAEVVIPPAGPGR